MVGFPREIGFDETCETWMLADVDTHALVPIDSEPLIAEIFYEIPGSRVCE